MAHAILFYASALLGVGAAPAQQLSPQAVLVVEAHQDFGLSAKHVWTAELRGGQLTVDRPGKQRRSRQPSRAATDRFRTVLRQARFQELPTRSWRAGVL